MLPISQTPQTSSPYPSSYSYLQPQFKPSNLIWVLGDTGAKSYQVYPNCPMILMDSESKHFYLKSADNSGVPTLKKFKFEEEPIEGSADALLVEAKKETEELKKVVADLQQQVSALKNPPDTLVIPTQKDINYGGQTYAQPNIIPANAIAQQQPTQQYSPSIQSVPQNLPGQPGR